jgi:hypothetical protein
MECDCNGNFNGKKAQHCIRISSTLIHLFRNYIDNAYDFNESKEQYAKTKKAIEDLSEKINGFHF